MAETIAIVGQRDVYLGFKALGVTVVDARTAEQAARAINDLARQGYSIIFVSEPLTAASPKLMERFSREAVPVVSVIPDHRGSTGSARGRIRRLVEKAVGIDILGKKTDA